MDSATRKPVAVRTTARLHLGFLNPGIAQTETGARRFGSLGLALDAPGTDIVLQHGDGLAATGADAGRAHAYLRATVECLGLAPAHHLHVARAVPAHAGLGSGTQLALAVARAVREFHGIAPDTRGDAQALGRGARSGIGIALFDRGGFAVDGGVGAGGHAPPLLARLAFPDHWRVLLLLDPAHDGLSGAAERAAFAALPRFPQAATAELCRLLVMGALPALAEHDLAAFGAAIDAIQATVGDHFAPAQGGRFTSPGVAAALAHARELGAVGIGQSSWGPTGFAFLPADAADRVAATLARTPSAAGLDIQVRHGLNRGATIQAGALETEDQAPPR